MATLATRARERGAELVGLWPVDGYEFDESPAVEDGRFVGLALDNANQYELTEDRIKTWVRQLTREFGLKG
jgi:Flavodoxin.